jgi:hypothetical protein
MFRNVQLAPDHIRPKSSHLSTSSEIEGDGEDTHRVLDNIEKRLTALERILWAMYQHRQSIRKRRTTFDYIESWLSTTVPRKIDTPGEQTGNATSDLAMEEAMASQQQ